VKKDNTFSLKTLKVKVKLSKLDKLKLDTLSNEHRLLYNHLLGYLKDSKTCDFKEIMNKSKNFRNENNLTISAKSAQNTARVLIRNIMSFYALRKKDKTARFPNKFKSWKFFTSFTHDVNGGNLDKFDLKEGHLILKLEKKHTLDIRLPEITDAHVTKENLKTITFSKKHSTNEYFLSFSYSVENLITKENKNFLSIDPGVKSIVTAFSLATNSFSIQNSRFKKLEKRIAKVQSKKDKCKVRSKRHKKLKLTYSKLASKKSNKERDFQHKVSKQVINICKQNKINTLVIGDIKTKKLKDSKVANRHLNKSTQNTGTLSRFKTFLTYKAKESGIKVSLQDEAYTSQDNCLTGERNLSSDLSVREVKILENLVIDRDLNSAINIAKRSKAIWLSHIEKKDLMKVSRSFQKMYYDPRRNSLEPIRS
jgi:putative transposase